MQSKSALSARYPASRMRRMRRDDFSRRLMRESTLTPDQLEEATRIASLLEKDSNRVMMVDVTPVNRTRNFHNFSLETPEFFDDLFLRLVNVDIPQNRLVYQIQTSDGKVYSVLTRGR